MTPVAKRHVLHVAGHKLKLALLVCILRILSLLYETGTIKLLRVGV